MNANLDRPERGMLDEALFDAGGAMLANPIDDVPEETILATALPPLPAPELVDPMQVVFPPMFEPITAGVSSSESVPLATVASGGPQPPVEAQEERADVPRSPEALPPVEEVEEHEEAQPAPEPSPVRLDVNAGLTLASGTNVPLSPAHLALSGAGSPFCIDVLLLSPPLHGTLLRDGFALTGGDVFTQEDIDQGRICYRHEDAACEDSFTFATPDGEVAPTEFRISVMVTRCAPEMTRPGRLSRIQEGCAVADLLGDRVACHEPDVEAGVAIVGVKGRGEWTYSRDGNTWRSFGDVYPGCALLLNPSYRIRFVPISGWSGRATLTYHAWDRSTHDPGQHVDLSSLDATGGATAFSLVIQDASTPIRAATLPPCVEPWRGQPRARDLVGAGLAVVRGEGEGDWQYSLDDGQTWLDLGSVYHGRALLLDAGDRVRFLACPGATGKVLLAGRVWDGQDGARGERVNLSRHRSVGEGTPFSEFVQTRTWRLDGE